LILEVLIPMPCSPLSMKEFTTPQKSESSMPMITSALAITAGGRLR
jgi:hypothetical protein